MRESGDSSTRRRGFVRTHRNTLVNPTHVREVRRRAQGEDWEIKLDPPVTLVLPVSRAACGRLSAGLSGTEQGSDGANGSDRIPSAPRLDRSASG
jgi:hypothetical protein